MTTYRSDVKLGELYRDTQTGFEGHATSVYDRAPQGMRGPR